MAKSELLMIGANIFLCVTGMWMCLCRMKDMSKSSTKLTIRVQYAIWFGYFTASLIGGTWIEPATTTHVLMTGAVVAQFLLGFRVWRYGPPEYTRRSMYEAMGDD